MLTDNVIKNAKPKYKADNTPTIRRITDERGMYLLANETGKYFRLDYSIGGNRKSPCTA